MDENVLLSNVDKAFSNLKAGSWGKLDLTFDIVEQTEHERSWADKIGQTRWGAEAILTNLGFTKDVDYDGILLIYNTLGGNGNFCCNGGVAYLGNSYATVAYSTSSWAIIRHEVGRK